jgi:ribosomal protein S18 acetylase RimI-like enzyme
VATPVFRSATPADIERVLPLMRDFYVFERLPFDLARSTRLLNQLVGEPRLGRLILFEQAGVLAGYMVVGFGFSLEFGGVDAIFDELYVRPDLRGSGIGTAALRHGIAVCREAGIQAIHLEADHFNERAHEFYRRAGFKDHARHLMTLWI